MWLQLANVKPLCYCKFTIVCNIAWKASEEYRTLRMPFMEQRSETYAAAAPALYPTGRLNVLPQTLYLYVLPLHCIYLYLMRSPLSQYQGWLAAWVTDASERGFSPNSNLAQTEKGDKEKERKTQERGWLSEREIKSRRERENSDDRYLLARTREL